MKKLDEQGTSTALLIAVILLSVFFVAALIFGIWAYGSRQDYKDNTDQKIAAAVKIAQAQTSTAKDNQFAEDAKNPLKTYKGPDTYGGVTVAYPKTWSGYVDSGNSNPLEAYFAPDVVPGLQSNTPYALRIEVTTDSYDQELAQFGDNVTAGTAKVVAYRAAKLPGTLGSKIDGQITDTIQGTMVIFPLRDKALKVWTESSQYSADFNNSILPNLSFSP